MEWLLCTFIIFAVAFLFFFLRNRSNTKDQETGQNRDEILGWKLESKQRNSTLRFEIYVGDPIRL